MARTRLRQSIRRIIRRSRRMRYVNTRTMARTRLRQNIRRIIRRSRHLRYVKMSPQKSAHRKRLFTVRVMEDATDTDSVCLCGCIDCTWKKLHSEETIETQ